MPVYSFSQIQTFQQCPLKYRYKYIDKLKVAIEPQSPHMLLGSTVHEVLEYLYKQLNSAVTPTLEQLLQRFHQTRERDIDREQIVFHEETPEDSFLRRGEIYLRAYRERHAPFGQVQVAMIEGRIVFSLDDQQQLKFRGVVDRLDKEWSTFIINDYKTNKHLPDIDKSTHKEQLTLYALGIQQKYGKHADKLMAKLHYLHFDLVEEWEIDTAMLDTITKKYSEIVRDIEDRRFHTNMGEDRFPANENPACKRCPYMSVCPLRAHMHMDDEVLVGESTVKTLVDEYAQLSAQASDIDKQKKAIKAALSTYLRHHKLQKLYGEHHQLSATPTTHRSIADAAALRKYLQEQGLLEQYLQLDRHALTRAIKDTDLDPTALGESMQQKESVTLRVSKKKA